MHLSWLQRRLSASLGGTRLSGVTDAQTNGIARLRKILERADEGRGLPHAGATKCTPGMHGRAGCVLAWRRPARLAPAARPWDRPRRFSTWSRRVEPFFGLGPVLGRRPRPILVGCYAALRPTSRSLHCTQRWPVGHLVTPRSHDGLGALDLDSFGERCGGVGGTYFAAAVFVLGGTGTHGHHRQVISEASAARFISEAGRRCCNVTTGMACHWREHA
jgi:hypothetical protein